MTTTELRSTMPTRITTGHPAGDAVLPAAERLCRAVRAGDPATARTALDDARAAAAGWEPHTVLAYTLAALVPDLDRTRPAQLLEWCTQDRPARLPAPTRHRRRRPPQPLPDAAALVVTPDGTSLHPVHTTSWTPLTDALVDLDDALDAMPDSPARDMLLVHRDGMWNVWRGLTAAPAPADLAGAA